MSLARDGRSVPRDLRLEDDRWWAAAFAIGSLVSATITLVFDATSIPLMVLSILPVFAAFAARFVRVSTSIFVVGIGTFAMFALEALTHSQNDFSEGLHLIATITAFYIGFRESKPLVALLAAAIVWPAPGLLYAFDEIDSDGWYYWTLGIGLCFAFGRLAHVVRTLAEQLAASRAQFIDLAVVEERRRIAGDVHDLVGHSLTAVILHVAAARRIMRDKPDAAEAILGEAEAAGRQSMGDIRRTVSLLRGADLGLGPTPGLGDLEDLAERSRSLGLDVSIEVLPRGVEVEPTVGLTIHRIAAEALANASKHRTGATASVVVDCGTSSCELSITSNGGRSVARAPGMGFGVVGMQERARSVGGSLRAGPTDDGWLVEATLPLDQSSLASPLTRPTQ